MLLELITGRRRIDTTRFLNNNIVDRPGPLLIQAFEGSDFSTLVDARLQNNYDRTEMSRMITCAACAPSCKTKAANEPGTFAKLSCVTHTTNLLSVDVPEWVAYVG